MKILLVGSTGLVGGHVLTQALKESRVEKIIALVRTGSKASTSKLEFVVVDFDHLSEFAEWWNVDAVICTLGTTIRKAGSQQAFEKVDRQYPVRIAEFAKKKGVPTYCVVTAMGANASSMFFYNRVKGNVEKDLEKINFKSLTIVRPGLIGGDRKEVRFAESVAQRVLAIVQPVLPKSLRLNPAEKIAVKLLQAAIESKRGKTIITSDQMI